MTDRQTAPPLQFRPLSSAGGVGLGILLGGWDVRLRVEQCRPVRVATALDQRDRAKGAVGQATEGVASLVARRQVPDAVAGHVERVDWCVDLLRGRRQDRLFAGQQPEEPALRGSRRPDWRSALREGLLVGQDDDAIVTLVVLLERGERL